MATFFVVDNASGKALAVRHTAPYPSTEAVNSIVASVIAEIGGEPPENYSETFKKRGEKIDASGREWCYVSADVQIEPGMSEVSFGKWAHA